MQVHYNVGENIVAYRTSHIGFVVIYVAVRIGGHFMNDDLSIVVLTLKLLVVLLLSVFLHLLL